jgi:hypothetical protein
MTSPPGEVRGSFHLNQHRTIENRIQHKQVGAKSWNPIQPIRPPKKGSVQIKTTPNLTASPKSCTAKTSISV